jgi:anti-sigma regulatory factor (Ser/Thr protein kinase)
VETFCDGLSIRDDLAMVLVRANDETTLDEKKIPFVLSSKASAISPFIEWAWEKVQPYLPQEGGNEVADEFILALSEVITNQSEHAYRRRNGLIIGLLQLSRERWKADLYDRGARFEPLEGDQFAMNLDDPPLHGYGMQIIRSLLDRWNYARFEDGRNHWSLEKFLSGDRRG